MEDRTKSLLVLCLINFVGGSGYSIMTPLFPPLVNHRGISEAVTGYIFCLYPVGAIIVSLILGATMELKTMKSTMLYGVIVSIVSLLGFGFVTNIESNAWFIVVACISRLLMGIGGMLCYTPCFSLGAYLFPDRLNEVMSYLEICSGVSLFAGPGIGSLFYVIGEQTPIGGYSTPFFFLAIVFVIIYPLVMFTLKIEIPADQQEQNKTKENKSSKERLYLGSSLLVDQGQKQRIFKENDNKSLLQAYVQNERLGYMQVLKIYGVFATYISFSVLFVGSLGIRTYVAVYIQDVYQLSDSQTALFFICKPIVYGITAVVVGQIKITNVKLYYGLGSFITAIACFLYGPDKMFTGIPLNIWVVVLADGLNGLGIALLCTLVIPLFITVIREVYPDIGQDANDMASALYMSGWNFGELAGPISGGLLITYVDFARSSSIFGFVILFATVIFFSYLFLDWKKQKTSKVDDMEKLLSK